MNEVYIVDAVRLPRAVAKSEGAYAELTPIELLKPLFAALTQRQDFDPGQVEDVLLGCSTQTREQGANLAKIAALYAGWPASVSGVTLNRF
ncbi:MAG: acetyl-CoA C-acyltransferase, partial [Cellvibrionaceae bacterium]|nr:acetyl-CoA C-acyltransferase [Cellvibrionaceae bacterium]